MFRIYINISRTALPTFIMAMCCLAFILLNPAQAHAARLWSSGCELQELSPPNMTSDLEWFRFGSSAGTTQVSTSVKRSGLSSCRAVSLGTQGRGMFEQLFKPQYSPSDATFYFRFYVYIAEAPTENVDIAYVGNFDGDNYTSNGEQTIVLTSARRLNLIGDTGSTWDTGSLVLNTGQWYRIEWAYRAEQFSSFSEVRVDGVTELSSGGSHNGDNINSFGLGLCVTAGGFCSGNTATGDLYFDDIAINDTVGPYQNSWSGPGSIVHMQPDSAGQTNNCASGATYADIDEIAPDNGTSICTLQNTGNEITANVESSSNAGISSADPVTLVQVGARHAGTSGSGNTSYQLLIRKGATPIVNGVTVNQDDTTYRTNGDTIPRNYSVVSYIDATTGLAWTPAGLDSLQIGANMISATSRDLALSTLWALVELASLSGVSGPVVDLSASENPVLPGTDFDLTWTSANTTSCTASGDWSGGKAVNGTETITGGITTPATYTLTCDGPGGSAFDSLTVTSISAELTGYAWSPNVGWISFNCLNVSQFSCDTISDYRVSVGTGAGLREISGQAWSAVVGWISFDAASLAGCPSGTCAATMDATTGTVTGWARVCSVFASGCAGALKPSDQLGGWEGWIKLAGPTYGILANGAMWSGYAWGGGSVTGTGEFSPAVGGNAVVGWISFRGFTESGQPYGVDANPGSSAEGPVVLSCGANKGTASLEELVTWSSVASPTLAGAPFSYSWSFFGGGSVDEGAASASVQTRYAIAGLKTAALQVLTSTGIPYALDCTAAAVPGAPSPWYPEVFVGDFQLDGSGTNVTAGTYQAGASTVPLAGQVVCYDGSGTDEDCDATLANPLTTPFDSVFQIVPGHQTIHSSDVNIMVVTEPQVTSIYRNQYINVSGSWQVPENACPWGGGACEFSIRTCADVTVAPGNPKTFVSWDGVVCEPGETSCLGAYNNNSCDPWVYFNVQPADAPPPSGGTCRAIPGITQVGRTVTWSIDPVTISGGEPPFEYKWEALPTNTGDDALPGTYTSSNTVQKAYTNASPATKRAQVTVRDAGGQETATPIVCTGVVRLQRLEEF